MRVALLLSGGGSNADRLIRSMTGDHPARPVLALSNIPGAGGLAKAQAHGVPVETVPHHGLPRETFETRLCEVLDRYAPDLICLAGFMRILTPATVDRYRMVNIHPSLLPLYPGLNTHARAIEAGDRWAGCTVHEVIPQLDAGPVLGQARVPVQPGDSPETLAARVLVAEHQLYPAVLRRLADGTPGVLRMDL